MSEGFGRVWVVWMCCQSCAGVIDVMWVGARDVQDGVMTAGQLVQFVIYAILVAGAAGALSEIWGELQRAAGATERLSELLSATDTLTDPARLSAPSPRANSGTCRG